MKNLVSLGCLFIGIYVSAQTAYTGMRGITAPEIAADMAPGLNLWNTLDAYCWYYPQGLESETCWGHPYTTPEMVRAFAERGFKTLRIPVTWFNHLGPAPDYIIDKAWMDRVEEVANYAFDNNMYVIINIHHDEYHEGRDGSWLCPTYEKQNAVTDQLEKLWIQIAERFKDYGDYLLFETMNEPREVGSDEEWTGGSPEHRDVVNDLNLAAINVIRSTGGNNTSRFILIPQHAANQWSTIGDLEIPENDTNIIVSVHNYFPFTFCLEESGPDKWGKTAEITDLRNELKALGDHFTANGQAIIMGEWGVMDKDNYADRVYYYDIYTKACKENGITPIAWIFEFNRKTLKWEYPMIEDAILQVYDTNHIAVEDLILNITSDTLYVGDTLQLEATIIPDSATSQDIIWTSYEESISTVSSGGLVTAIAQGRVSIKATTIGKRASCDILVLDTVSTGVALPVENSLTVYPNPARDRLNIILPESSAHIQFYSIEGKQIFQMYAEASEVQIDIPEIKPGIYFLHVFTHRKNITKVIVFH